MYIVVTAKGEEHPCWFGEIEGVFLCETKEEVAERIPNPRTKDGFEHDWSVFEILPGHKSAVQRAIIFNKDHTIDRIE